MATRRVYKYSIAVDDADRNFPAGYITHARLDPEQPGNHVIQFWVQHDERDAGESMTVGVVGTGHAFKSPFEVATTVPDGEFIWHLIAKPLES